MVSNEEIKRKLGDKKEGKGINGYLVCDTCQGNYELQPGEKPEDFSSECECGGDLKHKKNLTSTTENTNICSKCGEINENGSIYCQKCGNQIKTDKITKTTGKEVIKGIVYFIIIVGAGIYFLMHVADMFVSSILYPIFFFGGVIAMFYLAKYLLNRLLY